MRSLMRGRIVLDGRGFEDAFARITNSPQGGFDMRNPYDSRSVCLTWARTASVILICATAHACTSEANPVISQPGVVVPKHKTTAPQYKIVFWYTGDWQSD